MRGIILCGGKSSRMGKDKARLLLKKDRQGKPVTFLEHLVAALSEDLDICVASGSADYSDLISVPQVADIYQGCGPLAGIHAAMSAYDDDWFFVTTVDDPYMDSSLAKCLWSLKEDNPEIDIIVPVDETGHKQVLMALYSKKIFPLIEEALANKNYRVMKVLEQSSILFVDVKTLNTTAKFYNVNTPTEYDKIQKK